MKGQEERAGGGDKGMEQGERAPERAGGEVSGEGRGRGQEERGGGEGSLNPHQGERTYMGKDEGIPTKGIETAFVG